MESETLSALRVMAAVAWADGVLSAEEADCLGRLIAGAELDHRERAIARKFLSAPVDLAPLNLAGLGRAARAEIYQAAVQMAAADHELAECERALLARLRRELRLD